MKTAFALATGLLLGLWVPAPAAATDGDGSLVVTAAGSRIELFLDAQLPAGPEAPWIPWLVTSARAVATVSGRFPEPQVVVRLEARNRGNPVAFGQVRRGRPPRVAIHVNPAADLAGLESDWRSYHEFAHLLLPYSGHRDIWFSEGLASYYQYLLMARAGVISGDQAWLELAEGFLRGVNDPNGRGRTLRELSPDMWRLRAFRRVYWTGAAYFLRVDVRLRTETAGRHSLDRALAEFQDCCMAERGRWTSRSIARRLGQLSVPEIWDEEYRRTIDAIATPDFGSAFEQLGIEIRETDRVGIQGDASGAVLRAAIAAGQNPTGD